LYHRPNGAAVMFWSGALASVGREFVDPPPILDLLRGDVEAQLLLQRPGHRAAHRVSLMPTSA